MIMDFIVTDITDMANNYICIAGVNLQNENIRPVRSGRFPREWCRVDGHCIKPFSQIRLDFQNRRIDPPHTEDRWIDPQYCEFIRDLTTEEKRKLLTSLNDGSVEDIFSAEIRSKDDQSAVYIKYGEGNRSLGTINPSNINNFHYCQYDGRWDSRLTFVDKIGKTYRIKIKDLMFQSFLAYKRENDGWDCHKIERYFMRHVFNQYNGFLRIGLARRWGDENECCFLQITGVYPFSDYCNNFHFLDSNHLDDEYRIADDEIPF